MKFFRILFLIFVLFSCNKEQEKVLNVHFASDIRNINPLETTGFDWNLVFNQVFESLFTIDRFGKVNENLVDSWNSKNNETEFIFNLKKNIHFSNSEVLTSKVVKNCFEYYKNDRNNELFSFWNKIEEIIIINKVTLKLIFKEPVPDILYYLSSPFSKIFIKISNQESLLSYVGTGDFQISNFTNKKIQLKKNNFSKNKKFDEINFKTSDNVYKDLLRGHLDYGEVSRSQVDKINSLDELTAVSTPMLGNFMLGFNMKSEVWSNIKNRKILNLMIDKSDLIKGVKVPDIYIPKTIIPYGLVGYIQSEGKSNIEKAKEILKGMKKTELPSSNDLIIHLPSNAHDMALYVVNKINQKLKLIGWPSLTINFVENDYGKGKIGNYYHFLRTQKFNLYLRGMIVTIPSPLYILNESLGVNGKMNFSKYSNSKIDLVLKAFSSNYSEQYIQIKKINEEYLKDLPFIMLGNLFYNPAYNIKKLKNVGALSPNYIKFNDVLK